MKEIIVKIIAAMGKNNVIGKDDKLPSWKLSADLKNFKALTVNGFLIIGRRTYDSLPNFMKNKRDRHYFIVSRNKEYADSKIGEANVTVCDSLVSALHKAGDTLFEANELVGETIKNTIIYIVGGGMIYKESLDIGIVDALILTHVNGEFEGDTYFPSFDKNHWEENVLEKISADEENSHDFKIVEYTPNR